MITLAVLAFVVAPALLLVALHQLSRERDRQEQEASRALADSLSRARQALAATKEQP